MDGDPFDDLLGLEERFYEEGFQLGTADGEKAGRIEGRVFGLEKGFEKYVESGRLHGRSLIWLSRTSKNKVPGLEGSQGMNMSVSSDKEQLSLQSGNVTSGSERSLPPLLSNPRLEKHLRVLYALTEPASLSTDNSEDAVSDFDDRLKRALGRVKMIERQVGEDVISRSTIQNADGSSTTQQMVSGGAEPNIEDTSILKARH